jgi:hypothetical protein
LPPDQALELFTAAGEIAWAPGWRPRYVTPPDGAPVVGGIWLTDDKDGTEVIWRVQRFDRGSREAEYLRISPGNRVVTVYVKCEPDGAHTRAIVTYRAVAISDAGRAWLDTFTAEAHAEMMSEWQRLIAAYLEMGSDHSYSGNGT